MTFSVQILPVVEIFPSDYANRDSPLGDAPPSAWDAHFQACLADAGLAALKPIAPGKWHFRLRDLRNPQALRVLAKHRFDSYEFEVDEEFPAESELRECWLPFDGGVALQVDDEIILTSGCCSDLGDIEGWQDAIETRPNAGLNPWNGHDVDDLTIRFDEASGCVEFEIMGRKEPHTARVFAVPSSEAAAMCIAARQEQTQFAERLAVHLPGAVPEMLRNPLARLFAGLAG